MTSADRRALIEAAVKERECLANEVEAERQRTARERREKVKR